MTDRDFEENAAKLRALVKRARELNPNVMRPRAELTAGVSVDAIRQRLRRRSERKKAYRAGIVFGIALGLAVSAPLVLTLVNPNLAVAINP